MSLKKVDFFRTMISFEEIFVGERNRTMDVLSSSLSSDISQSIASLLDLPGQPPAGYTVEPFIFGAPSGDHYILAKLGPDPSATRSGMVFAHAFVAQRDAINQLEDLSSVLDELSFVRPAKLTAKQRSFDSGPSATQPPSGGHCDAFLTFNRGTVVTSDTSKMQNFIKQLWPRLLLSMRADFRFGLAFAQEEAKTMNLNVALVPPRTILQWPANCRLDDIPITEPAKTAGGRALTGDDQGMLKVFADELELEEIGLNRFAQLGLAYEYYAQKPLTFKTVLTCARLVIALQPEQSKGTRIKEELVSRLLDEQRPSSGQEVLSLRNLSIFEVQDSGRASSEKLKGIFASVFGTAMTSKEAASFMETSVSEGLATGVWQSSARNLLSAPPATNMPVLIAGLVELMDQNNQKSIDVLKILDRRAVDLPLSKTLEFSRIPVTDELHHCFITEKYFLSDVSILIAKHQGNLGQALREACERNIRINVVDPVNILLSKMTETLKVQLGVEIENHLVTEAAAISISKDPTLLYGVIAESW